MSDNSYLRGNASTFSRDFRQLLNNKEISDVEFLIGEERKRFYAHRCILSCRCDVFRAMFTSQKESRSLSHYPADIPLVLKEVNSGTFLTMLEFLYTNSVTLDNKSVVEVIDILTCAVEYGLEDLRKICQDYLGDRLDVSNICEMMAAATSLSQNYLKKTCLRFLNSNAQDVIKTKAFNQLPEEAVVELFSSDDLTLDELDVIKAVSKWTLTQAYTNQKSVPDTGVRVARQIRLCLLTPDELARVEKDNKVENIIPADVFSQAWKVHALKQVDPSNPLTRGRRGTIYRECHEFLSN